MEKKNNNENFNKGKVRIIFLVFIIILLFLLGYFIYDKYFANNENNNVVDSNNVSSNNAANNKPNNSKINLGIYVRHYDDGNDFYFVKKYENDNNSEDKFITYYECKSDDCKGYDVAYVQNKAVVYDTGKYYLYDYAYKESEVLDIGTESFEGIQLLFSISSKKVYGLFITNKDYKGAFYNLDKKKYITDFIYTDVSITNIDELLDSNYFAGTMYNENETKATVIDNTDGKVVASLKNYGISSKKVGNAILYFGYSPNGDVASIYNSYFKPFTGDDKRYYYAINSDDTITLSDHDNNKIYYIYDANANLKHESNEYKEIVKVVKDYVVILDKDDNLKLLDKNEKEITTFLKVTDNYKLHPMISGWYTENGKNGIYMVIENKDIPYGTEGSGLEYYYIPSTNETGVIKTDGVGGYAKPVLYLYPTQKTTVTISFEKPYLLTTTYPKYKNNWIVLADSNGNLYDSNNQYYYGLYWEELGSTKIKFDEGFYVTKDNAIKFLEEKTNEIGFTRREANEFIMYWLPILEKNEKSLVYFELTEERENYNKLKINPIPDSLLRVAIHVKKVDKYTEIKEQKLEKFERKGFTAVEWGGVRH